MSMIEIKQLCKRFSQTTALDGVSLTVQKGSIFGLVGSNGLRYKLKNLSSISLR